MLEEMMKKSYIKPEIEVVEIEDVQMKHSSHHVKPGHGYGDGGHYGPPGQGYTPDDEEYQYESELWES